MPLYVLSSLSIVACIWGFRHERSVEVGGNIETFFKLTLKTSAINVVNFGFFAVGDSVFCQCVTICIPLFETGQSYSLVMGGKFECILQLLNDTAL